MLTFNLLPNKVTLNEWEVQGGGTALEAISKAGVLEPAVPSATKRLFSANGGKVCECGFEIPAELKEALEAGGTIKEVVAHTYGELEAASGFPLNFTLGIRSIEANWASKNEAKWAVVSLTTGEAEALTLTTLTALRAVIEHKTAKAFGDSAVYLTVKVEPKEGGAVNVTLTGKTKFAGSAAPAQTQFATATGKATFQGSAAATQAQAVSGATKTRFAGSALVAQGLLLAAKGAVRFAGRVTVKKVTAGVKKVFLLILDE